MCACAYVCMCGVTEEEHAEMQNREGEIQVLQGDVSGSLKYRGLDFIYQKPW